MDHVTCRNNEPLSHAIFLTIGLSRQQINLKNGNDNLLHLSKVQEFYTLYRHCVGKFGKPADPGELKCMILNQSVNNPVTPIQKKFLISECRPCHLAVILPNHFDQLFNPLSTLIKETKI